MRKLPFIYRHKTASVLMGIWKMNINRNYCVIAYAMPWHSVHSPIPFKGIPEPPLEIACFARFFFRRLPVPDLIQSLYVENPSSNGNDTGRLPAGNRQRADAMGNEPQKRVCSLAGTLQCPDFTSFHTGPALRERQQPPLPIWQKFMMLNPLSFCGGYSTITLWMNSSFICFLIPPEKGVPYRTFFLPGNGSCIKSQLFPTVSAA